jgi:hypothetical protein
MTHKPHVTRKMYGIYSPPIWPYKPGKFYTGPTSLFSLIPIPPTMGTLSPYLPLPQPIHRSASSPLLRNVYNHRPALDPFLRAGPLSSYKVDM